MPYRHLHHPPTTTHHPPTTTTNTAGTATTITIITSEATTTLVQTLMILIGRARYTHHVTPTSSISQVELSLVVWLLLCMPGWHCCVGRTKPLTRHARIIESLTRALSLYLSLVILRYCCKRKVDIVVWDEDMNKADDKMGTASFIISSSGDGKAEVNVDPMGTIRLSYCVQESEPSAYNKTAAY
jgi:hypothetical protein